MLAEIKKNNLNIFLIFFFNVHTYFPLIQQKFIAVCIIFEIYVLKAN